MPSTSETTGRATTGGDDTTDALEGVYDSLRSGEATGEEAPSPRPSMPSPTYCGQPFRWQ